jgi:outer membrane protein TolC
MVRKDHTKRSRFYVWSEPFFTGLDNWFRESITNFLRKKWWAALILIGSVVAIFFFGSQLQSELSPLEDRNWLRLTYTGPEGSSFESTDAVMDRVSTFITDSIPEKNVCLTVTAPGFAGSGAVNTGFVRLSLVEAQHRDRTQQEIADYINKYVSRFPEGKLFVIQEQSISSGGGGPRGTLPVQFVLQTNDFKKLQDKLPKFLEAVSKNPTFQGFDANLKFNKPELEVEILRDKAKILGVSIADIAQTIQLALSGQRFSYYTKGDKQYQVIGQVDRSNRNDPRDLSDLYVRNNKGEMIQLDNITRITEQSSPPQLYHYNRYQSATVSAGLAPGKTIGDGIQEMEKIAKSVLDESFSTSLTGASRDYAESSSNILFAFLLALVLIYLLLAAQFESFIEPLIIMLSVPTALGGAIFSLWYFNQTLNIFSQIGMIMLIGLVTKNGILIIEFTNQLRKKGRSVRVALIQASTARLRPILMTSLATILGALPIALALGAGAKSRMGMGIVVIGGLLFSMILTLYVIPAVFSLVYSRILRRKRRKSLRRVILILITGFGIQTANAQEVLTIDNAIKTALEKNYDLLISKNNVEISKAQNNAGNAGMSPQVSLNGNLNMANVNSHQEFNTGAVQDRTGASSSNLGASLNVNWTVFDGMRMFAVKKRLNQTEQLSALQLKQQMEATVYDIILAYYDIVRINELIKAAKQNLEIYAERKKIAQVKLEIGSDSKVDFLLTQSDENKAKTAILQLELQLVTAKALLNTLMVRSVDTDFKTSDSIVANYNPVLEDLKKSTLENNSILAVSKQNELIIQQTILEARSANLPWVQLNGAYNFTRFQSQAGIIFLNRQNGFNGGITASWLLFNGNRNNRLVKERQLNLLNQKYITDQTKQNIDAMVYLNYQSFLTNKKILELEKQNLSDSKEVLDVSLERYKIGKTNLLETIETQKNLEDAQTRYINALYNVKKAEAELLRANGTLVK